MRKSLRVALRQSTSLYKGGCFPQKYGRRVRVSLLSAVFFNIQKKGTGENPDTFPGAEGETRRVFNPSCSLCEQVYFMSLFAPQKDGRRVRVSPYKFIYTKRKSTKEKSLCFFCEDRTIEMFLRFRCLDLNTLGTIILHYSVSVFKFFYSVISISVPPIKTTLIFAFDSTATQSNICRTT